MKTITKYEKCKHVHIDLHRLYIEDGPTWDYTRLVIWTSLGSARYPLGQELERVAIIPAKVVNFRPGLLQYGLQFVLLPPTDEFWIWPQRLDSLDSMD